MVSAVGRWCVGSPVAGLRGAAADDLRHAVGSGSPLATEDLGLFGTDLTSEYLR